MRASPSQGSNAVSLLQQLCPSLSLQMTVTFLHPASLFHTPYKIRQSSAATLAGWATATAAGCSMTPPTPLTPRPVRDPARHRRREERRDGGPVPRLRGRGAEFWRQFCAGGRTSLLSDLSDTFPSRCSELACLDELAGPCAADTAICRD